MLLKIKRGYSLPSGLVYGDDPPVPDPANIDPPVPDPGAGDKNKSKPKVPLTTEQQAFVNSIVAEERRKLQAKNDQLITQLSTEQNRAGTSEAEKAALQERIESLKAEFATKDELTQRDTKKKLTELEQKLKQEASEKSTWKTRFESNKKKVDLTSAAEQGKAFSAEQVVLVLEPNARLVEVVGEDGKPTGEYETKVRIATTDKDGKAVTLDLTPTEAVKQLKEMPEKYGNLFISGANGGLGGGNLGRGGSKGGPADKATLSTAEYMAERRKERIASARRKPNA